MRTQTRLAACLLLVSLTQVTCISCECGYSINDTSSGSYALFTDLFETDFLHLYKIPSFSESQNRKTDIGWQPQAYNITPEAARGPYGKSAEVDNVVPNPLASRWNWGGEGVLGGDPGLQVIVRGNDNLTAVTEGQGQMVKIGEIDAERDDMVYGSFRVGMKMSDVVGTCAAFFWYRNNTQEIDLEYLSAQAPSSSTNDSAPLNLVLQSPLSASLGYNAAPTSDYLLYPLPFRPSTGYHEYRFDWLRDRVDFYADGMYVHTFTQYIPDAPGRLMINHWSNGDPKWSAGPPATDAVLTVSYVKAYFNSSNATRAAQWDESCAGWWLGRTCMLPDQTTSIDPTGPDGNTTGKTRFFEYEDEVANQTLYPAATAVPGLAGRVELTPRGSPGVTVLLLMASALCMASLLI